MLEAGHSIGRYRIVELIGTGGMGEVYLAEDTELQRRVAIKLFARELSGDASARDHLLHEARSASALSHPNVCTVFEVGEDDGRPFIAMEFVDGRTLDTLIATRDLPAERVVRYGAQIADAIAHAHENGVIHRDLKSANVVITGDGRAKVLDFGLASTAGDDDTDAATREVTSAVTGRVSGTLPYMAPELLRGQEADARSDIWSLGVLLYEAAVGHLPFTGETAFEVSTAIMSDTAEIPVASSSGLKAVIQRCLEKSPGERYQSAAEVRAALEMLQSGGASSHDALSAEVAAAAQQVARANRWPAIAAVFSVVAVIALALFVVFGPMSRSGGSGDTPSGPAIGASGRPTIAVLPFRDHTGSDEMAWLADAVPSMLVTSLAQTRGLDVVSASRVHQIVNGLGEESLQELDAATLAEFAERSGAGAVVVTDLYYTGTEYRFDVQVEDVSQGRVLFASSATGPFVFSLVDEISARILAGLELGATPAVDSIATVTSDSLEAWRYYEEGMRARVNVRYPQALAAFEEAIRLDPEFALAYFQLARFPLSTLLPDPAKAAEYDQYVLANMDRIPERDRLFVEGIYAFDRDNDPQRAVALLEELVTRYPDHEPGWLRLSIIQNSSDPRGPEAVDALRRGIEELPASGGLHNQLGYMMLARGRYPEAVRAIERYVELNPEEANAYDSLAEIYTVSGQPEVGFEKYTEIIDVDPTWHGAYFGRAMTLAMLGRYDEALEEIETYREVWADQSSSPGFYGTTRGYLLARLGRYQEALVSIEEAQEAYAEFGLGDLATGIGVLGIDIAVAAGELARAGELAAATLAGTETMQDTVFRRQIREGTRVVEGLILARTGDLEAANRILAEVERFAPDAPGINVVSGVLAGEIALAAGDFAEAERLFQESEPELKAFYTHSQTPPTLFANNNAFRDGIARTRLARGDLEGAIRAYRDLLEVDTGSKYTSFLDPRIVLELARLYDQTGRTEEARQHYLRFAELWDGADAQFQPLVEEARTRAAELGG